jgi:glucosamine--fructose-6-phosphate aminotransferase (isomerizing)
MCGIIGYIGGREAAPLLIQGLKRLEYRGYDSAGIALLNGDLQVLKRKGSVDNLEDAFHASETMNHAAVVGIAHTRWATHGDASDRNAHPHLNLAGDISLIHNGIIENHSALRKELVADGYSFRSDTDSEVLVHLIDRLWSTDVSLDLESVVRNALRFVEGAYGICVISSRDPGRIVAARKGSPLVIGIADDELFIASDAAPIAEHTNRVVYLSDGEMAVLTGDGYVVKTIDNVGLEKAEIEIDFNLEWIEKCGYDHFMLKEIFEQPEVMKDVMGGRVRLAEKLVKLGGIEEYLDSLKRARRIVICACGTSWHAALIGEYLIEDFARIPVEVEYASEFRYRNPVLGSNDVVIVLSQSGETADTLAALRLAKERGSLVLGICNVVGSTIARETICGIYTHVGPEVGVASTKAFTAQVMVLYMLALALGRGRTLSLDEMNLHLSELSDVPGKVSRILEQNDRIRLIAESVKDSASMMYLGRGNHFPIALEGALKLKEISYIHAEGYPAAEMKHGPIALIDESMPVVVIALHDRHYAKMLSNVAEVRCRGGQVIAIATEGDREVGRLAQHVLYIPHASDFVSPLLSVIPLQLFAYHLATLRGCNVDRPRNLAKSVTVE